jgi:hypothetical protein
LVKKRLLGLMVVLGCVLALGVAGPTFAQTPTGDAYGGLAGVEQGPGDSGNPTAAESGNGGTLPFTGVELGVFALVGAGLLGTGLLMRRTLRSRGPA